MPFIRINNTILDPDKVSYLYQNNHDINVVTVVFDNGLEMVATGSEAMELWRSFDPEPGWRDDENKS